MGVVLRWERPDRELAYNYTRVYRASSKTGDYTLIATLPVGVMDYYDELGSTDYWYKLAWYESVSDVESELSDALQGGEKAVYTTVKKVVDFVGLTVKVSSEAVGTGNGTTVSFSLDNTGVVEGSDKVYVAAVLQRYSVDYTIDYDAGTIVFASAPANQAAVTADYSYQDIPSEVVEQFIWRAQEEINARAGHSFYKSQSVSERYDGEALGDSTPYSYYDSRFIDDMNDYRTPQYEYWKDSVIHVRNYPIIGVDSLVIYTADLESSTTLTSSDYQIHYDQGNVVLIPGASGSVLKGIRNVVIGYTYGYETVPFVVEDLCTHLAARRLYMARLSGDPTKSLSITAQNVGDLDRQIERLWEEVGQKLELTVV